MTPICFSITAQIPLIHDFMLSIRQCLISTSKNHHSLFSTKPTMTSLLALFLRLAATNSADRSLLSTFTHNVCNVMRGRILSLRHSVKHYKAPGINDCEFITVNGLLKILYYLANIFFRYILDFFLVINGKKVDTSICGFNNNIQRYDPKSTSLATTFALNPKTNLALTSTKRYSNIRIDLQFVLKSVNIISKRAVSFCQTFCLSIKLFSIIESYHSLLSFCSKLIDQIVKRSKPFASEMTFLHFTIAFGNGL